MISLTLKLVLALAVFWHTLAFAAGSINVLHSYRALFCGERYLGVSRIIQSAEWQLWMSGFGIISAGIALSGWDIYLSNPKLWAKLVLVTVWLLSTISMRRFALVRLRTGQRGPMLATSAVSAACWAYGAFLGGAKSLANGEIPFSGLLVGFLLTICGCAALTIALESHRRVNPAKEQRVIDTHI